MKSLSSIEISLNSVIDGLKLFIDSRKPDTLFDLEDNAKENNEARFQIIEGYYYDYQLNKSEFILGDLSDEIIQRHRRNPHIGVIAPNIYVGTLSIPIVEKSTLKEVGVFELEVQSLKTGYRDDYRDMLEFITEKCTNILMYSSASISQYFEVDFNNNSQTLYQKFAFIKSIIGSNEFKESIHKIVLSPVTKWKQISESKDIRKVKRFTNSNIKELKKGLKRTDLPNDHYLTKYGLKTLPQRINSISKTDSVDTPENRFVKYALEIFLKFCIEINIKARNFSIVKLERESSILINELESHLNHSIFKEILGPTSLKLNSPVLQRKDGYREVLRVWLMFDLAAKLIWTGGDDIYKGGKKDIAILYEYWLFFKLLDLFQVLFNIKAKDITELIKETPDGLNLQLKQGKFIALYGIYDSGNRRLNIRFSYNRSFNGNKGYPDSGSWTTTLRPDYTLTFWPCGISENEAEKQEIIVHIHFDAKYKIANLKDFLNNNYENAPDIEKIENRKGIYKNADLLKMHAYKDAIRRTGGAYVLYPGDNLIYQKGFHEIIPGLGAFPVKPSKIDDGIEDLKDFVIEIIKHFNNRASQREKIAYRTFDIYKSPPETKNFISEKIPEPFNQNRDLIPDESYVLIGYYNSEEQNEWIRKNKLYNFRVGTGNGSIKLDIETVTSFYSK